MICEKKIAVWACSITMLLYSVSMDFKINEEEKVQKNSEEKDHS